MNIHTRMALKRDPAYVVLPSRERARSRLEYTSVRETPCVKCEHAHAYERKTDLSLARHIGLLQKLGCTFRV